jgi:hypothetical protein
MAGNSYIQDGVFSKEKYRCTKRERKKYQNATTGPEKEAKVKRPVELFGIVLARSVASSTAHAHFVEAWRG